MAPVQEDTLCHEEHEYMTDKLNQLAKDVEFHVAEVHSVVAHTADVAENHRLIGQILDEVIGPKIHDGFRAGERNAEEGISHQVKTMWTATQNGGLNAKLSAAQQRKMVGWTAALFTIVEAVSKLLS